MDSDSADTVTLSVLGFAGITWGPMLVKRDLLVRDVKLRILVHGRKDPDLHRVALFHPTLGCEKVDCLNGPDGLKDYASIGALPKEMLLEGAVELNAVIGKEHSCKGYVWENFRGSWGFVKRVCISEEHPSIESLFIHQNDCIGFGLRPGMFVKFNIAEDKDGNPKADERGNFKATTVCLISSPPLPAKGRGKGKSKGKSKRDLVDVM